MNYLCKLLIKYFLLIDENRLYVKNVTLRELFKYIGYLYLYLYLAENDRERCYNFIHVYPANRTTFLFLIEIGGKPVILVRVSWHEQYVIFLKGHTK